MKNTRGLLWAAAVCTAVAGGTFTGNIAGQAPAPGAAAPAAGALSPQAQASGGDEFQRTVQPVLAKNCFSCHSDRLHSGNLSLEAFTDAHAAAQKPEVWQKVLDKLTAGQMPPRPRAPLSAGELADVTGWIRKVPGVSDAPTNAA